jgi:hypothetical protein
VSARRKRSYAASTQTEKPARRNHDGEQVKIQLGDVEAPDESLAERMRAHTGDWIAIKDDKILHASSTPQALVRWLGSHGQKADSVFRVPEDDPAASGLAPL